MSDSLWSHGLQHTRLPCPSPSPGVCSNSCPSSQWCQPTISSSVIPFSSCPQSFPASGSFPVSWFFAWGGQNIGASISPSVLLMSRSPIQNSCCLLPGGALSLRRTQPGESLTSLLTPLQRIWQCPPIFPHTVPCPESYHPHLIPIQERNNISLKSCFLLPLHFIPSVCLG